MRRHTAAPGLTHGEGGTAWRDLVPGPPASPLAGLHDYSASVVSKAAPDSLTDLHAETLPDGVHFSSVYMPLVRTPMIAPNARYRDPRR